ncbi:Zinc finger, RING-type [Sesbania bispinosa]|nr:Zinc finger, RING-type [Sesbania bispinosa]
MASGSICDAPLSSKKKRTNGSAKLKQIKFDVRREQWLSRVKKGCNVDSNGRVDHCPSSKHIASEENPTLYKENTRKGREDIEGNVSEEEEDDGCLDDWEAVADALYANDHKHSVVSESPAEHEVQHSYNDPEAAKNPSVDFSKAEFRSAVPESHPKCQAWKPDDALRPRCLPNLSKKHSSPLNSNWHGNRKTVPWAWQTIISQPSPCPICYEDLDVTDSNFLPCSCGFHLCLFCHKKILEADGRCPGCRKLYDHVDGTVEFNIGAKAFHITQSCSLSTGC